MKINFPTVTCKLCFDEVDRVSIPTVCFSLCVCVCLPIKCDTSSTSSESSEPSQESGSTAVPVVERSYELTNPKVVSLERRDMFVNQGWTACMALLSLQFNLFSAETNKNATHLQETVRGRAYCDSYSSLSGSLLSWRRTCFKSSKDSATIHGEGIQTNSKIVSAIVQNNQ